MKFKKKPKKHEIENVKDEINIDIHMYSSYTPLIR